MVAIISGQVFSPADLAAGSRLPGISAFMRIRNGADFLEPTIRSHIGHFDEIVAVYNQCTDATPDILARLAGEYGPERLRVFHYTDRVHPPGSDGHRTTPPDSPNSLVNYYNVALSLTRRRTVTKLDDDHLAIEESLAATVNGIRASGGAGRAMLAFFGLNLWREADGSVAIFPYDIFSGNGDIGFFDVTGTRYFHHDARFERFDRSGLAFEMAGFLYWHLKYLKAGFGFENYELAANPGSRYRKRRDRLTPALAGLSLPATAARIRPSPLDRLAGVVNPKKRFANQRADLIRTMPPETLARMLSRCAAELAASARPAQATT